MTDNTPKLGQNRPPIDRPEPVRSTEFPTNLSLVLIKGGAETNLDEKITYLRSLPGLEQVIAACGDDVQWESHLNRSVLPAKDKGNLFHLVAVIEKFGTQYDICVRLPSTLTVFSSAVDCSPMDGEVPIIPLKQFAAQVTMAEIRTAVSEAIDRNNSKRQALNIEDRMEQTPKLELIFS